MSRERFDVTVEEHQVTWLANGRAWTVGPLHAEFGSALGAQGARSEAIQRAHIDAKVPPFRGLLRQSWSHSKAQRVVTPLDRKMGRA